MQFGAIVVAGSGKVGGHVASRNKAGAYLRTKVTPVNPQTTAQTEARNRLSSFAQAWRGLTEAQRQSWNAAVKDFARTNVFGELKNPSGFNLYQRLNNNLQIVHGSPLTEAPQLQSVQGMLTLSGVADASASTFAVNYTDATGLDTALKIFATPPVSAGKSFVKNEFRLVTTEEADGVTTTAIGPEYEARFGNLVADQVIFIQIVPVNKITGQEGVPLQARVVVVA